MPGSTNTGSPLASNRWRMAAVIECVGAHQHFRHGLDIILVEQPDLEGGDFLVVADADRFRDTHPAFAQELAQAESMLKKSSKRSSPSL